MTLRMIVKYECDHCKSSSLLSAHGLLIKLNRGDFHLCNEFYTPPSTFSPQIAQHLCLSISVNSMMGEWIGTKEKTNGILFNVVLNLRRSTNISIPYRLDYLKVHRCPRRSDEQLSCFHRNGFSSSTFAIRFIPIWLNSDLSSSLERQIKSFYKNFNSNDKSENH